MASIVDPREVAQMRLMMSIHPKQCRKIYGAAASRSALDLHIEITLLK